jgi:uncharacterized membrane protein
LAGKGEKMLIGNMLVRLAAIATIVIGIVSYAEAREESVSQSDQIALVANAAQAIESVEGVKSALEANSNAGTKTTQESDSESYDKGLFVLKAFFLPVMAIVIMWGLWVSRTLVSILVSAPLVITIILYGIADGKYDSWIIAFGAVGTFIAIVKYRAWVSRNLERALAEGYEALAVKEAKEAKRGAITDAKAKGENDGD